jgi:hypothetical protein
LRTTTEFFAEIASKFVAVEDAPDLPVKPLKRGEATVMGVGALCELKDGLIARIRVTGK